MMNRFETARRRTRTVLGAACVLFALCTASVVVNSWGQAPSPDGGASPGPDDPGGVQDSGTIAVLEAQLDARRNLLRIDESRAELAKQWSDYYEKMFKKGRVIEDRMRAARDDVLMMNAHVAAERAELKVAEIHARYARRRAEQGSQAADGADQAREELDELESLLEAKRSLLRVGESRAEQARRVQAHYEKLFRDGLATEDLVFAARDEVLMMDSALAWGRADVTVAETRVKNARRAASRGGPGIEDTGRRIAELEERLAESEMRADILRHEVGRLRRELPRETHGAR